MFIIIIMTLWQYSKYAKYNNDRIYQSDKYTYTSGALLMVLFVFLFGMRSITGFGDTSVLHMDYSANYGDVFTFMFDTENFLFDNLLRLWASSRLDFQLFMLFISIIYFGCSFLACRRFFPNDTILAYVVFLSAFSTFSYGTNGIKAGAAASIFLLALSYYDNFKIAIPLLVITVGMHHSMQLCVASVVLSYYYKKPKVYFYVWLLCLLFSMAHVTFFQTLFMSISTDEKANGYLEEVDSEWGGKTGFRYDFVLYSVMPILVGYYAIFKKKIQSAKYGFLFRLYLTTNGFWLLCMYAEFTNRIAYLSWLLYPIVLIYPFLKENLSKNQYITVAKVALAHTAFTAFMYYIYY